MFSRKSKKVKPIEKATFQLVPKEEDKPLDFTNPILSPKELALVKKFWSVFEKDLERNGLEFAIFSFFRHYRDYLARVKGLAFIFETEWGNDPRFRHHSRAVVAFFGVLIECAEEPKEMASICKILYDPHIKLRFSVYDFENLRDSFIEFLSVLCGHEFNSEATQAWKKLITFAIRMIYGNRPKPGFFRRLFS